MAMNVLIHTKTNENLTADTQPHTQTKYAQINKSESKAEADMPQIIIECNEKLLTECQGIMTKKGGIII